LAQRVGEAVGLTTTNDVGDGVTDRAGEGLAVGRAVGVNVTEATGCRVAVGVFSVGVGVGVNVPGVAGASSSAMIQARSVPAGHSIWYQPPSPVLRNNVTTVPCSSK
jgi:hypothetical protein